MNYKALRRILTLLVCLCSVLLVSPSDVTRAASAMLEVKYTPDNTLSKFIEDHLPGEDYKLIDSGDGIPAYAQKSGGENISYVAGELAKEYGIISTTYYAYKNNMSVYQCFLEIRISTDAVITDKDRVYIDFSGMDFLPQDTVAVLYVGEGSKIWKWASAVNVVRNGISTSASYQYLSGDSILNNGKERRIFVHIPNISWSENNVVQNFDVMWEQDVDRLGELSLLPENPVEAQPVKTQAIWKLILIALITVLDISLIIFFICYIRKKRNKSEADSQESENNSVSESTEHEAEKSWIESGVDRKQEDLEYLKSIGYFDSKPSKH